MSQSFAFSVDDLDAACSFHETAGFVGIFDLLLPGEVDIVKRAIEEAVESGDLVVGKEELSSNNDVVFLHPAIMDLCRDPRIVGIAKRLVGQQIELQHAKFNAKPTGQERGGQVDWHQDYPFYPHTNFDLVSCVIHVDDETEQSGALRFVEGSHRMGPLPHTNSKGEFEYKCTDMSPIGHLPSQSLSCSAGFVSFHHCLTMHSSSPNSTHNQRRIIVFQYRAVDSIQLAGVVWRCNGLPVDDDTMQGKTARFPDGTTVELRGHGGRLFDIHGRYAPDR